ncbi:MAG: hypothetical protein V3U72_03030 [Candidatus Aenigmarchaeota archaeon]
MNGKMEMVKKSIDDIKKEREELREKYDYLVEQMKRAVDKHSQDIDFLKNEMKGIADKEGKDEGGISNLRSVINSLEKKIATVGSKQSVLKEKLNEEVELMGGKLDSEISEKVKMVRSELVDDLKREIEKSLEGLQTLEKDAEKIHDKDDKFEEKLSNIRSVINSLSKSLSNLENKHSLLKEKFKERVELVGESLDSEISERMKIIQDKLVDDLKVDVQKNLEGLGSLGKDVKKLQDRDEKYEEKISNLRSISNSTEKSLSELSGMQNVLKEELHEKINSLEKEMCSELAKLKGLEERLGKDVEDFEKFAGEQKSGTEKFKSKISGKMDMFAMEKENLKRDFSSLSNDFKNIGGRLDSLKEKDSDLNQRLQNSELKLENFKRMTEEILGKIELEQNLFKENLVAKLNEASDKILNRLSQNELKTSSEFNKQSEDIKLFRAHVTKFINDLVTNYEKRFNMIRSEIDQALRLVEEKGKEQRAMIFE